MQPKITDFSETDRARLAEGLTRGRALCRQFDEQTCGPVTPASLDRVFLAWLAQPARQRASDDDLANGLGYLFGELLKTDFGFIWQLIEDQYGIEPALIDEGTGSVVFPLNAVWKRISPVVDGKAFFQPMYDAIAGHLKKERAVSAVD